MSDQSTVQHGALQGIEEKIDRILSIVDKDDAYGLRPYGGHADQGFGHLTYAQFGEDLLVLNIFQILGISRPSYLDVGAHHPINVSNTALLYARGCQGINVEANPHLIEDFHKLRPNDRNLNVGVGPTPGMMNFYMIDRWSGRNTFDRETAEAFVREYPQFKITEVQQIEVKTINQIVDSANGGVFPEFLSMDLEGLDYDVLDSADFSKSKPIVICVETLTGADVDGSSKMIELMNSKGYKPFTRTLGNVFFVTEEAVASLWR